MLRVNHPPPAPPGWRVHLEHKGASSPAALDYLMQQQSNT